jgi:hypothetical protein
MCVGLATADAVLLAGSNLLLKTNTTSMSAPSASSQVAFQTELRADAAPWVARGPQHSEDRALSSLRAAATPFRPAQTIAAAPVPLDLARGQAAIPRFRTAAPAPAPHAVFNSHRLPIGASCHHRPNHPAAAAVPTRRAPFPVAPAYRWPDAPLADMGAIHSNAPAVIIVPSLPDSPVLQADVVPLDSALDVALPRSLRDVVVPARTQAAPQRQAQPVRAPVPVVPVAPEAKPVAEGTLLFDGPALREQRFRQHIERENAAEREGKRCGVLGSSRAMLQLASATTPCKQQGEEGAGPIASRVRTPGSILAEPSPAISESAIDLLLGGGSTRGDSTFGTPAVSGGAYVSLHVHHAEALPAAEYSAKGPEWVTGPRNLAELTFNIDALLEQ